MRCLAHNGRVASTRRQAAATVSGPAPSGGSPPLLRPCGRRPCGGAIPYGRGVCGFGRCPILV